MRELPALNSESFVVRNGEGKSPYLLLCDHATNAIPARFENLGLSPNALDSSDAYDVGAAAVVKTLSERLDATAVLTCFSRLLVDPNRADWDPENIAEKCGSIPVPKNMGLSEGETKERIRAFSTPYHHAVERAIELKRQQGVSVNILSLHSFTPHGSEPRPWHCSVIWERDTRFSLPLLAALRQEPGILVGENVPYSGEMEDDTLDRHGARNNIPNALVEIRNDLLRTPAGIEEWALRLERVLGKVVIKV